MKRPNRRTRMLIFAAVLFLLLTAVYAAGVLIPDEAVRGSFMNAGLPPSPEHPFGTDSLGRDLFLRTLKGLSVSMTVGLAATGVSAVIALLAGFAAAAGSKTVDSVINWLIDLVMSVPHTILVILISFAAGRGAKGLMTGIAATHWCSLARLVREEVMGLRGEHYAAVSRKLGKSPLWVMKNHMLPGVLPQFISGLVLLFPHAVIHEAAISFLGFGLPPEQPAIGIILSESMRYISAGMWWQAVLPGVTLVMTVLLIDKLGEEIKLLTDPFSAQE
ncbi:MAG: ABC transporter permease [Ruminococcus sp.]|nr:ABC transporter permease [Ruminococcus sp.]